MAAPIVERIAEAIKTRLKGVTIANGYSLNVNKVIRPPRLEGWAFDDRNIYLTQSNPARNQELDLDGNPPAIGWDQVWFLGLIRRPSDRDSTPIDTLLNYFRSDVEKAVCTPAASWHNWGGLAIQSSWDDPDYFPTDDGGLAGLGLFLRVSYRTSESDPYTAR